MADVIFRTAVFSVIYFLIFNFSAVNSEEIPPVLRSVYSAQEMLQKEKPYIIRNKKSSVGRNVPLALYDYETGKIFIIRAGLSFEREIFANGKVQRVVDVLDVNPKDFYVYKIGGNGINTEFAVIKDGKPYYFLGWNYIRENGETLVYSPYSDFLATKEIVDVGKKYLIDEIATADAWLGSRDVSSRAIPGSEIAEIIPERLIFNLALIEHMDHDEYEDRGAQYMANKVLTQFALNRERTYSYSRSSAGALCLMQIMRTTYGGRVEKRKGKVIKVHPGVMQLYPSAELPANPVSGSCDSHSQAIKVAYLVLDDKLAYMPYGFQVGFLESSRRLGYVLAAAYNGGSKRAVDLYFKVGESNVSNLIPDIFDLITRGKHRPKLLDVLRNETWVYIRKYSDVDVLSPY